MIVGLDLSLNATGVATATGEFTIAPNGNTIDERVLDLHERLCGILPSDDCRWHMPCGLIVIEDLPRNPKFGGPALGMAHGAFILARMERADPDPAPVLRVTPATLKKFATGKGNAAKDEMLVAAVRRLGYGGHDHNQADALWLRAIGHHLTGDPLIDLPKTHTDCLAKLTLPERLVA